MYTDSLEITVKCDGGSKDSVLPHRTEKDHKNHENVSVFMKEHHLSSTPKHLLHTQCKLDNDSSQSHDVNNINKSSSTDPSLPSIDKSIECTNPEVNLPANAEYLKTNTEQSDKACTSFGDATVNNNVNTKELSTDAFLAKRDIDTHNKGDVPVSSFSDLSKDSGISEVNTTNFSHQDSHDSGHYHSLSPRSSLSDEAKQWLGKRGIKLPSLEVEGDASPVLPAFGITYYFLTCLFIIYVLVFICVCLFTYLLIL